MSMSSDQITTVCIHPGCEYKRACAIHTDQQGILSAGVVQYISPTFSRRGCGKFDPVAAASPTQKVAA